MKRIKKIQAIILTVCMTLFGLGVTKSIDVYAVDVDDTFTAKIDNITSGVTNKIDCTFKITKLEESNNKCEVQVGSGKNFEAAIATSTAGTIVIPETVTHEGSNYTVTSIGDYAFYKCENITNTGLDNNRTVTNIGNYAYNSCYKIEDTTLSNNIIKTIGRAAFSSCKELKSTGLEDNDKITSIANATFRGCAELKKTGLENHSTIKSIGEGAFGECSALESTGLSSKSSVETIGDSAFDQCIKLRDTGLKNNAKIKMISNYAFYQCSDLISTGLENNDTITSIGNSAFDGCSALKSTGLETNSKITSIGNSSFKNCKALISTGLENNVITSIGNSAFEGCSGLTSTGLERNTKITNIGNSTFKKCTSLTKTGLENNTTVTDIREKAFSECTSLENVYLPSNSKLSTIGNNAFDGCTSLESFVITGEQVPTFGTNVFTNTPNDFAIYYPLSIENGTVTNIKNGKKIDNSYIKGTEITIEADSIEGKTFKNWSLDKGSIAFDNSKDTTTLTMKEEVVKVTANYEDAEYTVTINGKQLDQKHIMNDEVTIVANSIEGKRFKEWQVVSGNAKLADKTKSTTTLTMTAGDVEVIAVYDDLFKSTINGGTGSKDYIEGETVTITADTVEGKQFKEWQVVSENVTLADKTKSTTTFTMPAGNVEVKAIYEDIPVINQGGNTTSENENTPKDEKANSDVVKTEDKTKIELMMLMVLVFGIWTYMISRKYINKN